MTGIRYHAAALLRALAHRIHPIDTDALPITIKVPPGALDKIRRATPEELARGRLFIPDEIPKRRPPAGGTGEMSEENLRRELVEVLDRYGYRVAASGWTAEYGGASTLAFQPVPVVPEERIPSDLNTWAGVGVLALHNHTETDKCDDTCSVYDSRGSEGTE